MIVLKATTESLQVDNTDGTNPQCSISWVDVTTSSFTPSSSEPGITVTSWRTLVAAPAASTQRQIKYLSITPTISGGTLSVAKQISATRYVLCPRVTLALGDTLTYSERGGWRILTPSGLSRTVMSAAGSNKNIQYNSGGSLAGSDDLTWDDSSKSLALNGTDTDIIMKGITTEPGAPASDHLTVYAKAISGKMSLKWKGPSGIDTPLQVDFKQNNWNIWMPGAAAGGSQGGTFQSGGTAAIVLPTTTNIYTIMRRSTFASVVTTQNQQVGIRTEAKYFRGNASGMGGFFYVCRFGFDSIKTNMRAFVGLTSGTTAVVTVNPSTLTNMLGFGFDLGETAWTFMHNDASGTCTKETISGQGTLATNNTGYDAYIFCPPNGSTVYYRLDRTDTGAILCDTSVTTDLPVNTTMLTAQCIMSNGTANIVVGDAKLGINRLYVETDR